MNSPNICAMVCVFSVPPDLGWCDDFSGFFSSGFGVRLTAEPLDIRIPPSTCAHIGTPCSDAIVESDPVCVGQISVSRRVGWHLTHHEVYRECLIMVDGLEVIVSIDRVDPRVVLELFFGDSGMLLQTQYCIDVRFFLNC